VHPPDQGTAKIKPGDDCGKLAQKSLGVQQSFQAVLLSMPVTSQQSAVVPVIGMGLFGLEN
jgi:hypothetical protein